MHVNAQNLMMAKILLDRPYLALKWMTLIETFWIDMVVQTNVWVKDFWINFIS